MPQKPNAKSIEARERYKAGEKLVDIAKSLGVPDGTVRRWKSDHGWDGKKKQSERSVSKANGKKSVRNGDNDPTPENQIDAATADITNTAIAKTDTPLHPQARPGNKNALGNKGGKGGPPKNKKAVKTHEYEKIFYSEDSMNPEEFNLATMSQSVDKLHHLQILIGTLKVREQRILRDIKKLRDDIDTMVPDTASTESGEYTDEYTYTSKDGEERTGRKIDNTSKRTQRTVQSAQTRVMALEETLTRVQARLQRAIEILHKIEVEERKLGMDYTKLELYRQRLAGVFSIDDLIEAELMDFPDDE